MQKIDGLLKSKGISLTQDDFNFCLAEIRRLGISKNPERGLSAYIRLLIAGQKNNKKGAKK